MALPPASRIGTYEVVAQIGAGGMGEVYRARDLKLGRSVAIKILPEAVASDAQRIARFEQEAKILAALNHQNIAAIYGLEDDAGIKALVMELVDGPTLEDRIVQGAVPVAEALLIAKQVAEALEAAHEQGIIHRDLKPSNIKVRADGTVKVLDFGLAKAVAPPGATDAGSTNAPTLARGATQAGTVLGTVPYMSPEQLRGRAIDARADIWAFGCVLYEMLTGRPAFRGDTASDIISAILTQDPDWTRLPVKTPPGIRQVLSRCLDKDIRRRVHHVADIRIEIEDALSGVADLGTVVAPPPPRRSLAWAGGLVLSIVATALIAWYVKPDRTTATVSPGDVARLRIALPEPLPRATEGALTFSPDGRRLAFVAGRDGHQQLWVREIDSFDIKPIAGTDGADTPRFSPDGRWLAFVADRKIKRVALEGGTPTVVADFTEGRGLTWETNDRILFNQGRASGLWRVGITEAMPEMVTRLHQGENEHDFPEMLPDGAGVLYSANTGAGAAGAGAYRVFAQVLDAGEPHPIGLDGVAVSYLPSGQILYVNAGTLYTIPFDLRRLTPTGTPVAVLGGVTQTPFGAPLMSVSTSGSLAYVASGEAARRDALVWVNTSGGEELTSMSGGQYAQPRLAPDGHRVAVTSSPGSGLLGGNPGDIWLDDLDRGTQSRLTFDGRNQFPLWTPDARQLTFSSSKSGPFNIYLKALDGAATDELFFSGNDGTNYPLSWSPDGQHLAFVSVNPTTANDIWVVDRANAGKARPFLQTQFREGAPAFSPDGRWIAYASDRSGRTEIYMRPTTGAGEEWTISTDGGNEPVWARDVWQLFYRQNDTMMVVDVKPGPPMSVSKPRRLFDGPYRRSPGFWANFDVTPDGKRLLMVKTVGEAPLATEINVVLNWRKELERLVPVR